MEQILTVATFNERAPAETLKDRLIDAGFHADLQDDSGSQAVFFLSRHPRAHMHVNVRKEEYERAKGVSKQWESEGTLGPAVRCPQCGGSRIEYPQWSRRTMESFLQPALRGSSLAEGIFLRGLPIHMARQSDGAAGARCAELATRIEDAVSWRDSAAPAGA
jgi:hypothetical protein